VVEQHDGDRILHLNEGWAVHSVRRLAVIGNAGGTVSNLYAAAWPGTHVDGVEIDPMVTEVGRRYLGMGRNPNLRVHTADGRFWLRGTNDHFDAVVIDAYRQPYIPFHLATREFFQLVRDRLNPHGVVAINVGTPPDLTEAVDRIGATMRDVFPAVHASRYDAFNSVLIAYRDPADAAAARDHLRSGAGLVGPVAARLARTIVDVPAGGDVLTDDLAPLERITDTSLLEYLRQGAPGS
jgi:hypothetical protein